MHQRLRIQDYPEKQAGYVPLSIRCLWSCLLSLSVLADAVYCWAMVKLLHLFRAFR